MVRKAGNPPTALTPAFPPVSLYHSLALEMFDLKWAMTPERERQQLGQGHMFPHKCREGQDQTHLLTSTCFSSAEAFRRGPSKAQAKATEGWWLGDQESAERNVTAVFKKPRFLFRGTPGRGLSPSLSPALGIPHLR